MGDYLEGAKALAELPYTRSPYSSRAWGNPLHSLCSYQGKLKPSIAHFLVKLFTQPGDTVLDPFSGSGTIPLEARLQGRIAIANDLQELAYILSFAKVSPINNGVLNERTAEFLEYVTTATPDPAVLEAASGFGLNGTLSEYFHQQNLAEIVNARTYIKQHIHDLDPEHALIFSAFLHILHGNRPYALSRTSHPVTPLKPKGEFEYREMSSRILAKLGKSVAAGGLPIELGGDFLDGRAYWGSYEAIPEVESVDAVITSPPFAGSTRFHSSNWMRLWAAGWDPEDFRSKKPEFLEEQQKKGLGVYGEFFDAVHRWLKPGGRLILHLGKTAKIDMRSELQELAAEKFEYVFGFDESVEGAEKFGIRDQGATKFHQFLFLRKAA